MLIGWFMRRVVFPLGFWWQMRKQRAAQQNMWGKSAADDLDDDLDRDPDDEPTHPGRKAA